MNYYEVLPADPSYTHWEPLTYSSSSNIPLYTVVTVPIKKKAHLAIVNKKVKRPAFKTRDISKNHDVILAKQSMDLLDWMRHYYPGPLGRTIGLLLPSYIATNLHTTPTTKKKLATLPPLTPVQRRALKNIGKSNSKLCILHGDTGSGKTRVYAELIQRTLADNKSAIVLTPEIGLTPQLYRYMSDHIKSEVYLLHSKMTAKEKATTWHSIASSSEPVVVVGPRSALFSPIQRLGLIIVDEFHDHAYKQEQAPHYQSTRVVAAMTKLWKCQAVYGSATPSIADYYAFNEKKLPIVRMEGQAKVSDFKNDTVIIDARDKGNFVRSRVFSETSLIRLSNNVSSGHQTLIFHNKRGTARLLLCQECGWEALCPACDTGLTYHADSHTVHCHTCGYRNPPPSLCPECGHDEILYYSPGTKALEEELKKMFPSTFVARFDSDNLKKESLQQMHHQLESGKINIIIGTQLITKGLDLRHLRSVIITSAESGLQLPDYTSEETSYQQLRQVMGRVGRGHQQTEMVIQTHKPSSRLLKQAISNDYHDFYKNELAERKKHAFPPFSYILVVRAKRKTQKGAINAIKKLHGFILDIDKQIHVSTPHPCFKEKAHTHYRWQIVIRSKDRKRLVAIINQLPANTVYDIDPVNLLA